MKKFFTRFLNFQFGWIALVGLNSLTAFTVLHPGEIPLWIHFLLAVLIVGVDDCFLPNGLFWHWHDRHRKRKSIAEIFNQIRDEDVCSNCGKYRWKHHFNGTMCPGNRGMWHD